MTDSSQDPELAAIRSILAALDPLDQAAERRVLDYVLTRLGIPTSSLSAAGKLRQTRKVESGISSAATKTDIKSLKEAKDPKTTLDMAVLVALYLSEYAPVDERKSTVSSEDLEVYFKQAKFQLPKSISDVLPNAKKAGYMDNVSRGEYKLTPVGYNLAVHGLPKQSSG